LGRSEDSDIVLAGPGLVVSRRHAHILWQDGTHVVRDDGSSLGTFVNGTPLAADVPSALQHGDSLRFANLAFRYFSLAARVEHPAASATAMDQTAGLASLEPSEVVESSLALLRTVSGVERSLLVGVADEPALEGLLTPLGDPGLRVTQSLIREAVESRRTVARFLGANGTMDRTRSMDQFQLRRVWIHPLSVADGPTLAVVYLDSTLPGDPFSGPTEARLVGICQQIALALRNAVLHWQVLQLNRTLEARVEERTRALEASRAQLIAQDRLVTLGRLVAGIAHELNNPAAAIDSFSGTLERLLPEVQRTEGLLAAAFPEPAQLERAQRWLREAAVCSSGPPLDSRARRALEQAWGTVLERLGAREVELSAQRLARTGLSPGGLDRADPLAGEKGPELAALLERHATFVGGLATLRECSTNIARIVRGLKTYAHLDQAEAETADIHRGIEAALSILRVNVPEGVEAVTKFAAIPAFLHRPGELMQVWTNLIDNALRSMGQSGTLEITTAIEGDRAVVTIGDTGRGIPPELQARIFELDVTSRGPGAGLGLGLAICRNIVEMRHGGSISFESRPGRTVFAVAIPMRTETPVRRA
jgi:signal transduction histidine kinase